MKGKLFSAIVVTAFLGVACTSKAPAEYLLTSDFLHDASKGVTLDLVTQRDFEKVPTRGWRLKDDVLFINADMSGDGHLDKMTLQIVYVEKEKTVSLAQIGETYTIFWPFEKLEEIRIGDLDKDGDADIILDDNYKLLMSYSSANSYSNQKDFTALISDVKELMKTEKKLEAFKLAANFALGTPHDWGVPGEGKDGRFDSDPEVELDKGNCVTWVEKILAILNGNGTYESFTFHLTKLRYRGGDKKYEMRNHFQSVDWIPNNISAGYIADITESLLDHEMPIAEGTISKKNWYAAKTSLEGDFGLLTDPEIEERIAELQGLGANMEDEYVKLGYYPFDEMYIESDGNYFVDPEFYEKLPGISIFNVANGDWKIRNADDEWITDLIVSHVGFLVKEDGRLIIYHSTSKTDTALSIMAKEDLISFLESRYIDRGPTTAFGFHLSEPNFETYSALSALKNVIN